MRILCLINPAAGGKKGRRCLDELERLRRAGAFEGEVAETRPSGLANQLAGAADFDFVLLGGGDGTIALALPCLLGTGAKAAILPLGTANDLARETRTASLRRQPLTDVLGFYASARAADFTVWRLSYGPGLQHHAAFTNYCSFGYDSEVVRRCHVLRKALLYRLRFCGPLATRTAYCLAGISALTTPLLRGIEVVSVDAAVRYASAPLRSLLFPNISSMMGLGWANGKSSGFDDQIELQPIRRLADYGRMFLPPRREKGLMSANGWEIRGLPAAVPVQLDGEPRPDISSDTYRITPAGSVKLLIA